MSHTRVNKQLCAVGVLTGAVLAVVPSAFAASHGPTGFGFNSREISGAPTGAVFLTGSGAYNPATGFVHSGGGFRCTEGVAQGPLTGCLTGQGVRWDTAALLTEARFKCTGQASEAAKIATTNTITVPHATDFYNTCCAHSDTFAS